MKLFPRIKVRHLNNLGVLKGRTALWLALVVTALAACSTIDRSNSHQSSVDTTTIYLVRHAEKAQEGRDPPLTSVGHQRAAGLADLLSNVDVDAIWSSNYVRTRSTVEPLAVQAQTPVTVYDARDSAGLVSQLLSDVRAGRPGLTHVVAGHSNTVPELVDLLEHWPNGVKDGDSRPHLDHDEYGLLFVVTYVPGRAATVEIRRF